MNIPRLRSSMSRIILALFSLSLGLGDGLVAQTLRRYESEIFPSYTLVSNIQYGQSITSGGSTKVLYLDLYTGAGDTAKSRPLMLFIHGGGFKGGDKVSNFGTRVCGSLARRGYVVASINYRTMSTIPNDTVHFEAMLRALQDGKAAVRFFRERATTYGIDTSQIFATGSSAGSITALHMAFLDSLELPPFVNLASVGGTFEGTSGNPGYSSTIHGVISNWGAIGDTSWMGVNDRPVYCVHGDADVTVFYDSIPADGPFLYGSKFIFEAAQNREIESGLRVFVNTGHTLDNNAAKQDSAIKDFSAWLFTILKTGVTGVDGRGTNDLPQAPQLRQNYPNPFNPETVIEYTVGGFRNQASGVSDVRLVVYDMLGREMTTLVNGRQEVGVHEVRFDASGLASGVYLYRLTVADRSESRRMTLLR